MFAERSEHQVAQSSIEAWKTPVRMAPAKTIVGLAMSVDHSF